MSIAARQRFDGRGSPRWVLRWLNKPQRHDPTLLTLNTESGRYCRFSPDGSRILTWSSRSSEDLEADLWVVESGRRVERFDRVRLADPPFVALENGSFGVPIWSEGTIRLFDADSGGELRTLGEAPASMRRFSVAPGGGRLALGHDDGRVNLIEVESASERFDFPAHDGPVETCLFLLGGRRLLTRDKSVVRLFDVGLGTLLLEQPDRDGSTYEHFEVSADERWFALEEKNEREGKGWTTLWNTGSGRSGLPVTGGAHAVRTWGLSPQGDRVLAIEFELGEVTRALLELWNVASNARELALYLGWLSPWPPVRFSPDGRWLAAGRSQPSGPGDIEIWDLQSRSEERVAHFQGHSSAVSDLVFSADSRSLASIDLDGKLRLWVLPVAGPAARGLEPPRHPSEVEACVFTPDGRVLVSSCAEVHDSRLSPEGGNTVRLVTAQAGEIRSWDAETGTLLQRLEAGQRKPSCFAFSPDGRHIAISSRKMGGEAIRIWAREGMLAEAELAGHRSSVLLCRYTPDGQRLVSVGFSTFRSQPEDNALKLWDPLAAVEVATLVGHAGEMSQVDLSPDGRYAVAASELLGSAHTGPGIISAAGGDLLAALGGPRLPADLYLWDLERRAKCASLEGFMLPAFSPDGQVILAISGRGRELALWQSPWRAPASMQVICTRVSHARFTPDGKEVVLALDDGAVAFIDPATGTERVRLRSAGEVVHIGQFSSDGRFMLGTGRGFVRIWDVVFGECVASFPVPAHLTAVTARADMTRLALGDSLGGVSVLQVTGIQNGPAVVTAVRVWRFGSHGQWRRRLGMVRRGQEDIRPSATCPSCGVSFAPPAVVLDAVRSIALEAGLGERAPSISLPREAWDEQRLLSACGSCGRPVRFTPFVA